MTPGGAAWAVVLVLPALALLVAFFLYPFVVVVVHAFTEWDGIAPARYVGLDNFREVWGDPTFRIALRNNALFALAVPLQVAAALVVAVLVWERVHGWRVFRAVFFVPVVMSPIIIGLIWTAIFGLDGPVNDALSFVGLDGLTRDWLGDSRTSIPAIIVVVLWASLGFNMTLFLAGLSALAPSLVDAARVDGAGWLGTLRHVIVPSLRRVIEFALVLNLITAFAFMVPYVFVMTGGGPGHDTYVVELLIYEQGFTYGRLGYASAISVALFAVISVLMVAYIRLLQRADR